MGWEILVVVVAAIAVFELVEHVILPISAAVGARHRRAATGAEGMVGRHGQVIAWSDAEGRVLVAGEIWRAEGHQPLEVGDEVVVRAVRGLTVEVTSADGRGPGA